MTKYNFVRFISKGKRGVYKVHLNGRQILELISKYIAGEKISRLAKEYKLNYNTTINYLKDAGVYRESR